MSHCRGTMLAPNVAAEPPTTDAERHRCRCAAGLKAPDALHGHLVPGACGHYILRAQLGSMSTSDIPRSVEVGALQGGHAEACDCRACSARSLASP
jgi:hypothetical protein